MKADIQFDPKLLGAAIRWVREYHGLSLRELARGSGVSHSQILRIESGEFDCLTSSFVRLCGAMGIGFSDLLERCVLPKYEVYSDAIEVELRNAYPPEFPSDEKSEKAIKDLVFGGCVLLVYLIRTNIPERRAVEFLYPSEAIKNRFAEIAAGLARTPPGLDTRFAFLQMLQAHPLATLRKIYHFPQLEHVIEHVKLGDGPRKDLFYPWIPLQEAPELEASPERIETWVRQWLKNEEIGLTDTEISRKEVAVKPQLPGLLERLRKATAQTGKKSELADYLKRATKANVPLASVSRWLSGEREPGGEVTLQLLRWVEFQERGK